jgi:hypothetical protein
MARKKPANKAKKKTTSAKKSSKKIMKTSANRAAKAKSARKASRPAKRATAKKAAPASAKARAGKSKKTATPARRATAGKAAASKKPNLDRPRKTVADIHGIPSSLDTNRSASMAKSGRAEMKDRLKKNTSASPALTSGDVDADWEAAEAVGDEAPGGDNPTPDQDVVDDIGRALGVEYEDDEELQGGAEIVDRDRHRWELDPSSKDDFEEEE